MTFEKRSRSYSKSANRIGVLVLGMHRSGTSALTRVLNLLGCDLPATLMNSAASNEAGHWESMAIMDLNDEILQSAGSNWHDWMSFNPGWYSSPKAAEYKEKAIAILESEFGRSSLFALKDPRICRFAPFWIEVLEAAGVQPVIVTQVRNPLEVASSLSKRDGFEPALGQLLWLRHVLDAESGSRGRRRFHASYEGLLNGWPGLASGMQNALEFSWPRLSAIASAEIGAFLTENLRHHVEHPQNVIDNPLLSSWLRDAFAIFRRWTEDGEAETDHAELDRIRSELDGAAPAFAQLILSGEHRAQELKSARHQLEESKSELSRTTAALTQQVAELEEGRRALSEAQTALTRSEGELNIVRGQLSQTQSALAQRSTEAEEVTAQLQVMRNSLAEMETARGEEIAALTRLLQEKEAEVSAAIARSSEQTAALERQVAEADQERKQLRAEKRAMEGRIAERFSELAVMTSLLGERENAAKAAEEQLAWLQEVSGTLLQGSGSNSLKGRLAALMPARARLRKQKERLKEAGIFDPDAYLAANPDVAEAGMDPLRHYIEHGIAERRCLQPIQETSGYKGNHEKRQ